MSTELKEVQLNGVTYTLKDEVARTNLDQLSQKVTNLEKNGVGSGGSGGSVGSSARIGNVTLLASKWVGTSTPYSQVVTIDGVTENSQVDLTPSVQQLSIFYEKDLAFVTENYNGVVTVYAIGQKPQNDYTIQVTITEVSYE